MKACTSIGKLVLVFIGMSLLLRSPFLWAATQGVMPSPGLASEHYNGRDLLLYTPAKLPVSGTRALVVILHGGLGNAARIVGGFSENALNMNALADKNGFIVVYLNGTPVTRRFGADMLGWNAGGGCCGVPAENNVDDVAYIQDAIAYLRNRFDIDPQRVYGMGHSNGAMMTQRLMCETGIYAAAISISGPLNVQVQNCPAARGKRLLAIHGVEDQNVPLDGGQGSKGLSRVDYHSEQYTQQVFTASGADFHLQIVPGADHALNNINARIEQTENMSLAQKAVTFFGLDN